MGESEVKVIGKWSSPYAMRVKIALRIKSIEHEHFEETLNPKSDLLLKSNPVYARVPVLIHHGKPISESLFIVEYIDETWSNNNSPSILPSDPYDRAIARFWATYIDEKWFPSMKSIITVETEEEREPYYKVMEEVVERVEEAFGKCSKGKPFFGGDSVGFLDIAFGSFLGWLHVTESLYGRKVLVEAKAPSLVKWAERFADDPAVKGLIPDHDKLLEISKPLQIKWRALAAVGKKY
ncbi:glutathione S-transferase U17-like [Arachis stenosperma]|uniref:glutathione S-transferase U17-like n=1 Tax=Arachis stenosperma TaxID=217475 RepID=UPI0025AC46D6|nr:glutathione S-transferase U17-like [Arachis stenosperma]